MKEYPFVPDAELLRRLDEALARGYLDVMPARPLKPATVQAAIECLQEWQDDILANAVTRGLIVVDDLPPEPTTALRPG